VKRVGGALVLDGVLNYFLDSWAVTGEEWRIAEEETLEQGTGGEPSILLPGGL